MAAKLALAALISLGLLIMGVATVHVLLAESTARAAASHISANGAAAHDSAALNSAASNSAVAAECNGGIGVDCEGASRQGHLAWNAASWLVGLALVVGLGRRGARLSSD